MFIAHGTLWGDYSSEVEKETDKTLAILRLCPSVNHWVREFRGIITRQDLLVK